MKLSNEYREFLAEEFKDYAPPQPTWNELMTQEAAALAAMEDDERTSAYDAGATNARDTGVRAAVPDGCPFPDSFIDGWADEMDAMIEEAKERR